MQHYCHILYFDILKYLHSTLVKLIRLEKAVEKKLLTIYIPPWLN